MFASGKLLAQANVTSSTASAIYTNSAAGLPVEITLIIAVNNDSTTPVDIHLYHDDAGGSTFSNGTQISYETLTAKATATIIFQSHAPGVGIPLADGAQIGAKLSATGDVTVSIYGAPRQAR